MRITILVLLAWPLAAQGPLSMKDAAGVALAKHPSMEAAAAEVKAAEARREQARSGYLPKVNYSESWQRSDNPVFVFSSLLTQHQFSEQNFAIGPLNRPDAMNNFQSQVAVDQPIFDAGMTRKQVRSAELGIEAAGEDQRRARMGLVNGVVRTYAGALLSQEALKVALEAVRSAEADVERAENVRTAGMSTDADVLAIRVHLASMREQQIRRGYDAQIAMAALNEALGLPLDTQHDLTTALTPLPEAEGPMAQYEQNARASRPEARQVRLSESLARTQSEMARASLLPQISFRAALEADRQRFINRGGANWFTGVTLRWNLFNGYADKYRIQEANQAVARAQAQGRQIDSAVSLQVRSAYLDLKSAQERIQVTEATVAEARESLRIIKNRYENGLNNVTDLLRGETSLLEANLRWLTAMHDQRLAAAALELAAGTLSADSTVLN